MRTVRVALAQVNPTVGDLDGNRRLIERAIEEAKGIGADLVAAPEMVITGYPAEDLVLKPSFVQDNLAALSEVAAATRGIAAIVGFVDREDWRIYNAAALIADGEVRGVYHKHRLPNYGVFDEERYFEAGEGILLGKIGDLILGVTICEDVWSADGPHVACAAAGASLVININGSPYHRRKGRERLELLQARVRETGAAFAYVNMVGGQDELVFDGQSMAIDSGGQLIASAAQFEEELLAFDFHPAAASPEIRVGGKEAIRLVDLSLEVPTARPPLTPRVVPELDPTEEVYRALVLGVRDYLHKNGFSKALVGLSGGIDSALTATIAADAIGPQNVLACILPSEFSSHESVSYAEQLARNLGTETVTMPINDAFETLLKTLDPVFAGTDWSIAEENVQARIRGLLLMAISNKYLDRIVLSTGNKSEMATGYATLYGDMAGGFAVLKDVPKTLVYELARWRNRERDVIPQGVIDRPPSAELRAGQLDTDSLPPYEILDPILEAYVEDDRSVEEIISQGFDPETVRRVAELVDKAEYKRRQAPPGIKITERAFGRDRRLPITNRYRPVTGGASGNRRPRNPPGRS